MKISDAEMTFDEWRDLAERDPETFETMRQAAIEAVIEAAPLRNQERLRRLQWRIDQERRLAGSPLGACMRLSRMMWKSVLGPGGLQDRIQQLRECGFGAGQPSVEQLTGEVVCLTAARESR